MLLKLFTGNTEENNRLLLRPGHLSVNTDNYTLRFHDGQTLGGFEIETKMVFNFGPGPKELVGGTLNHGFFGVVSDLDLLSGPEVAAQIGLSAGTDFNFGAGWLKFAYRGKILFVAKKPLKYGVSWDDIYKAGAVYGIDDVGPFVASDGTARVQDSTVVTDRGDVFRVRLLTGGNANPAADRGGEWNDLIYPVHVEDPTGRRWASYTDADLHFGSSKLGRATIVQETSTVSVNQRVQRGSLRLDYFADNYLSSLVDNAYGWRPVLELVHPDGYLFAPLNIIKDVDGLLEVGGFDLEIEGVPGNVNAIRVVTHKTEGLYSPSITDFDFLE